MYTEKAIETMRDILDNYSEISRFYAPKLGNFEFYQDEVQEFLPSILRWLEEHPDYMLIHQEGFYYLTDFKE